MAPTTGTGYTGHVGQAGHAALFRSFWRIPPRHINGKASDGQPSRGASQTTPCRVATSPGVTIRLALFSCSCSVSLSLFLFLSLSVVFVLLSLYWRRMDTRDAPSIEMRPMLHRTASKPPDNVPPTMCYKGPEKSLLIGGNWDKHIPANQQLIWPPDESTWQMQGVFPQSERSPISTTNQGIIDPGFPSLEA